MLLVEHILEAARTRLVKLSCESPVSDAAEILMNPKTPLAVVCNGDGVAVGVISRTDVIKVLVDGSVEACSRSADAIMTKRVFSCRAGQPLQQVWESLNAQSLRCAPILDDNGRPQGVVHARDLASALLKDVTYEEVLLRDYVLGIGYQ